MPVYAYCDICGRERIIVGALPHSPESRQYVTLSCRHIVVKPNEEM